MKLSELKTGEKGVIVKVLGHGGFRKRVIEMGFIKGKEVEVLLNAPLQDPVKYKLMGYEVSLRHDEAELIEIISEAEAEHERQQGSLDANDLPAGNLFTDYKLILAKQKRRIINVALIGNPNCGKTSLFNFASGAHGRVGNYAGVTVDATEARATFEGYEFNLTDLPGTYSLSCYSPEELYVRQHLFDKRPDIVINIIDASNLERNLYLTTQLVDMNLRMVCALNMYDEFEHRGDRVNIETLSSLFGVPMIPTSFKTGMNVDLLFHIIINMYEGADFIDEKGNINPEVAKEIKEWHDTYATKSPQHHIEDFAEGSRPLKNYYRHIHVNHGQYVERGINTVQVPLKENEHLRQLYSTRYLAIKLLENDTSVEQIIADQPNADVILEARKQAVDTYKTTHLIDSILSNKWLGFPIFFLMLFLMFEVTFELGQYPMDWIEAGVAWIGEVVSSTMPEGSLRSLLVDGVIGGVGSVIVFLPQILILYFFISLMEDSGYMARAAFIMDKLMHKMGLHGKSFIPLIMGFGCNVPAVMATRTIESRRSRLITMMILPFMSCSARLPIYIMITGTFFSLQYRSLAMISLYAIGILIAVVVSNIFSRLVIKGEDTPFVMELPPYRMPTAKAIGRHTWEKGKEYLKKMGGVILVASVIVWTLQYFPHDESLTTQQQQASTLGVIYSDDDSFADDEAFSEENEKYTRLRQEMLDDGITPLAGYCYLLFVLLYFPCIATIVAIKNETGSWRWASFAAIYTTCVAWVVSAAVYQIGTLL